MSSTAVIIEVVQPRRFDYRPDGTVFLRLSMGMEARLLVHVDAVDDPMSLSGAE